MEKIDRNLIIVDICSRIPYGTKVCYEHPKTYRDAIKELTYYTDISELVIRYHGRCYLRPMSSMTEEEKEEFVKLHIDDRLEGKIELCDASCVDFYNSHHLDYRGLIPMGLALEAPEGMYNVKK